MSGWPMLRHAALLRNVAAVLASSVRQRGFGYTCRAIAYRLQLGQQYRRWLAAQAAQGGRLPAALPAAGERPQPVISVLLPVYNPPQAFLREALDSVRAQTYPHWELCIADDASRLPHVRPMLETCAAADSRVKVCFRGENGHISRASNAALELARGEFVALLDHDDRLAPEALAEVAAVVGRYPDADLIYSDEDKIDGAGRRFDPFFKPQWSPESLLARNYVSHLGVYRRSLLQAIGGFRAGFEGSQDHDLVLRFTERTDRVQHIPKILYHWRFHSASAAAGALAKPYACQAGQRAVAEALVRRGEPGSVETLIGFPGLYRVRIRRTRPAAVSVVVAAPTTPAAIDGLLRALPAAAEDLHLEVLVASPASAEQFTATANRLPTRFLERVPGEAFSAWVNRAAGEAQGDYLLFLDGALRPGTSDWLESLLEQAQRPAVAAVGPVVLDGKGRIVSAGLLLGVNGVAEHALCGVRYPAPHYGNFALCLNNVSAIGGGCLMCRREAFLGVGGFEAALTGAYHDVDLCLKLRAAGYRNVCVPHAVLNIDRGGPTAARPTSAECRADAAWIRQRWAAILENDPCYSPNLSRTRADFALRCEPRAARVADRT